MNLLGIVGAAGAGRRTVVEHLRAQGFCALAFEDPIRKIVRDTWGLPEDVLWGSSELRECPLYVCATCSHVYPLLPGNAWECVCPSCEEPEGTPIELCWCSVGRHPAAEGARMAFCATHDTPWKPEPLTVRLALQRLGEWGRALDPDVWVRLGLRRARELQGAIHPGVGSGPLGAHRDAEGTYWPALSTLGDEGRVRGICLTDARFANEAEAIRAAGGRIWRVARPPAEYVGPTVPPHVRAGWDASLALGDADRCDKGGWESDKAHRKVWCWLAKGHGDLCQGATERSPQWAAYRWAKGHPNPEIPPYDESWRSHASETEGASIEADLLIRNDGTLDDLREKVVSALAVTQAQGAWADWESRDIDHEAQE